MARVCHGDNLRAAWATVRRHKGQGGSDGLSLADFERDLLARLRDLQTRLQGGTYRPLPLKAIRLPKANGRWRLIRIPSVADRIVQQAILRVIEPRFERKFCECTFGFRPGRSAHQAVRRIQDALRQGLVWVVEADLEDFFDTLDRPLLLAELAREIPDRALLHLIRRCLAAGDARGEPGNPVGRGTPQGAVFSPLLANAYLHPFDTALTAKGLHLTRYGDDFVTLHRTRAEAVEALSYVREVLQGELKLRLNAAKTRIVHADAPGFDFLSFRFAHGGMVPAPNAVERFKADVQRIMQDCRHRSRELLRARLEPLVRGWGGYFRVGQVDRLYQELDAWVQRQLRAVVQPGFAIVSLTEILGKPRKGGRSPAG